MQLIRGIYNVKPDQGGCVATIGNFDGLHLGHLALLDNLKKTSAQLGLPSLVITFEPQPNEFFCHGDAPSRLMTFRGKLRRLKQLGIDRVLCLRFDKALATMSAEDFVTEILVGRLNIKYVVIGDDFRFGAKRAGDIDLLTLLGQQHGFTANAMSTFEVEGKRVSSTRVREALNKGELAQAKQLLGQNYGMPGRVAHGDKRGRLIGFPTANIFLHRHAVPIHGVYAVIVHDLEAQPIYGVANVGNRPTVGGTRDLLEIHLFDFNREIYGEHLYAEFHHKLRDEKKFDSFELLKQQLFKDAENAKVFFASTSHTF